MEIRSFLYPLGFLSSALFTLRFLVQWWKSEKAGHTVVPRVFWKWSLAGNLLLIVHSLIQVQFPVAFVQTANAVISWRNLTYLNTSSPRYSKSQVFLFLFFALLTVVGCFALQSLLLIGHWDWVRTPQVPWSSGTAQALPLHWHLLGFFGMCLFALRFWVQWWQTERLQRSTLSKSFWFLSLLGGSMSLVYFLLMHDWVHILGYGTGLIPYLRNLMLASNSPSPQESHG